MEIKLVLLVVLVCGFLEISLADRTDGRRGRPHSTRTPAFDCPALECPDSVGVCPYGWKHDEHGCRLCECKPSWRCRSNEPQMTCRKYCEYGFTIGADNCPTCECYDPAMPSQLPAPTITHHQHQPEQPRPEHHHHGVGRGRAAAAQLPADTVVQLPAGTAAQLPAGAAAQLPAAAAAQLTAGPSVTAVGNSSTPVCGPMCLMFCSNGMKTDANGCPICECNDETSTQPEGRRGHRGSRPSRRRGLQCVRPMCAMFCPNGNRRDQTGCTLCECHQPGDAAFQTSADSSLQCPVMQCHRTKNCAHGFASDHSSGCPSCVCRTTPGGQ